MPGTIKGLTAANIAELEKRMAENANTYETTVIFNSKVDLDSAFLENPVKYKNKLLIELKTGQQYLNNGASLIPIGEQTAYDASKIYSRHLVGFWPLTSQKYTISRDISGLRNHWVTNGYAGNTFAGLTNAENWLEATVNNYRPGRLCRDPLDQRFDITGPAQSFLLHFQHRRTTAPASESMCLLGKGGATLSGGKLSLNIRMEDNSGTVRANVIVNNTNKYSSNIPNWAVNKVTNICIVRDSSVNRIFVYFDGILDAAFDSVGYTAFNPTVQNEVHNLSLAGYGTNTNNAVAGDASTTGTINGHQFRNMQLYVTPAGTAITNHASLAAILNADASHILTLSEL